MPSGRNSTFETFEDWSSGGVWEERWDITDNQGDWTVNAAEGRLELNADAASDAIQLDSTIRFAPCTEVRTTLSLNGNALPTTGFYKLHIYLIDLDNDGDALPRSRCTLEHDQDGALTNVEHLSRDNANSPTQHEQQSISENEDFQVSLGVYPHDDTNETITAVKAVRVSDSAVVLDTTDSLYTMTDAPQAGGKLRIRLGVSGDFDGSGTVWIGPIEVRH